MNNDASRHSNNRPCTTRCFVTQEAIDDIFESEMAGIWAAWQDLKDHASLFCCGCNDLQLISIAAYCSITTGRPLNFIQIDTLSYNLPDQELNVIVHKAALPSKLLTYRTCDVCPLNKWRHHLEGSSQYLRVCKDNALNFAGFLNI